MGARLQWAPDRLHGLIEKGGHEHSVWAPKVATDAIADYLGARRDDCQAMFVTHDDGPTRRVGAAGVREAWHELADTLGIPRWTTHQLRHSCATELHEGGVPPEVVAAHLGHHGLSGLAGYGEVRPGRRRIAPTPCRSGSASPGRRACG